ncbi:MAG TPA: ATP-binding protein [Steroidobacteraceae bacterium]|nr:ATP-binding protein [Steroidobacteraceae bacterium]
MKKKFQVPRAQWMPAAIATAFALVLTTLLVMGLQRAVRLQAASSALQSTAELRSLPDFFGAQLALVQRSLESKTYVGDALRNIRSGRQDFDRTLRQVSDDLAEVGPRGVAPARRTAALQSDWQLMQGRLADVDEISASPYDDTATGSDLSASGQKLKSSIDAALERQADAASGLNAGVQGLSDDLQQVVISLNRELRVFLVAGAAVAVLLLALMMYFSWRSRVAAGQAAQAMRQMADILGTVREGLFLLDRQLNFGRVFSTSFEKVLRNSGLGAGSFQELLRPIVPEKTIVTAVKFVNLLWREKINEELIESVNPLNQVEVRFPRNTGGEETRYLSFAFKRVVREQGEREYLLGSVTDVTDRVLLARELEESKAQNQSQLDMAMEVLRVDPAQLQTFMHDADMALRKSNAVLTVRGHGQSDLKSKLNGVFREVHGIKGEAAALRLSTVSTRIHQLEDQMAQLRQREQLDGNDFVPLVVKLDELMSHINGLTQFAERLRDVQVPAQLQRELPPADADLERDDTLSMRVLPPADPATPAAPDMENMLVQLTREVAVAEGKKVQLKTKGLAKVPEVYVKAVRGMAVQLVRNAVVHGIELPADRVQQSKPETGTVSLSFDDEGQTGFRLLVEDDGQGLRYEKILDQALRSGMIAPQDAAKMDRVSVYKLIFRPGFTTVSTVSEHAGRGVGLDAVSQLLTQVGGTIGIATSDGKFTRFKMTFPPAAGRTASAA